MLGTKTIAGVAAGLVTAGAAVLGVGTLTSADASTHTSAKSSTKTAQCHRAQKAHKKLPEALRADLKTAREMPAGQRGKAMHAIRDKALAKDYGEKGQHWAIARIRHQAVAFSKLPKKLRHDMRAVHKLPADDRAAARKSLHEKVLSGGYGDKAQKRAERAQQRREACKAQRQERQKDGTSKSSS